MLRRFIQTPRLRPIHSIRPKIKMRHAIINNYQPAWLQIKPFTHTHTHTLLQWFQLTACRVSWINGNWLLSFPAHQNSPFCSVFVTPRINFTERCCREDPVHSSITSSVEWSGSVLGHSRCTAEEQSNNSDVENPPATRHAHSIHRHTLIHSRSPHTHARTSHGSITPSNSSLSGLSLSLSPTSRNITVFYQLNTQQHMTTISLTKSFV